MFNIENFLLHCSGVDKSFSKVLPKNEIIKFTSIGKSILIATLFSLVSSFYAVYLISSSTYISILSSITWASFIYSLDRYIISSMLEASNKLNEVKLFIPRFILAVVISTTISVPLSLAIFEDEINEFLKKSEIGIIHEVITKVDKSRFSEISPISKINSNFSIRINDLNQQLKDCNADFSKALKIYYCELDGSCGSGTKGKGLFFEKKHNIYTDLKNKCASKDDRNTKIITSIVKAIEKNTLVIESINEKYSNIKKERVAEIRESTSYSLIARVSTLSRMSQSDRSMQISSYLIHLLILFMNMSPVLIKLLSKSGLYEKYIHEVNSNYDKIFKELLVNNPRKQSLNRKNNNNVFSTIKSELSRLGEIHE